MLRLSKIFITVPVSFALLTGVVGCSTPDSPEVSQTDEDLVPEGSQEPDSDVPYSVTGEELAGALEGYLEALLTSVDDPQALLEVMDESVKEALGEERYAEVAPEKDTNGVSFIQTEDMTEDEFEAVIEAVEGYDALVEHVSFDEGLTNEEKLSLHTINILAMYSGAIGVSVGEVGDLSLNVEISGSKYEISDSGTIFVESNDIIVSSGDRESDSGTDVTFYVDKTGIKLSGKALLEEAGMNS